MLAAICCLFALFLFAPLSACAGIAVSNSPLTVLMDFESPHSEASLTSLRQNLNQLLTYGGIHVDVELRDDLPANPQFGQLVIFKMKGACTMGPLLKAPMADRRRESLPRDRQKGPLAMAYTSDGQVLHFGEVECDSVRYALQKILGFGGSRKNQETYGAALAIVIAHEVYHMLGNDTAHTKRGLTKPSLSAAELASPKLSYSPDAIAKLRQ